MGIRREICEAVRVMEKSAGFGDWLARQSRRAWGALGVGAANLKYVADAVGNTPRLFGAKDNWWGDDFQSTSWKDYNKAGWQAGKGLADVMAGGMAKGLTLGLSDTVNDVADHAAVQSERNLHGNASADRAQKLMEMRQYYRGNGPMAFQQQYGSADPELLEAFSKGDTGLSDDVRIAQKGSQMAGNLATIPLGNAAIGAAGKGIGAVAGAVRGGGAAAQLANGAAQTSRAASMAHAVGRAVKPAWNFATKYRAPIAGTVGIGKGVKDGIASGSVTQGIESGLNAAATSYLLTGGPWRAYVPMSAVGDAIGEYGRTGNVMDSMAAGSQGAARNALLGKAFNVAPATTMAATAGVPMVVQGIGVGKKYKTLQGLQLSDEGKAALDARDRILRGEKTGGGGFDGYISREDMSTMLGYIPEEKRDVALANWLRRLHGSGKYNELSLNDLPMLRQLEQSGAISREERNRIAYAIVQQARQTGQ